MKLILRAIALLGVSFFLLYGCGPEPVDPADQTPKLVAVPEKTAVVPYEIFRISVKEETLTQKTYQAKFGEFDITLMRVNDTLLVGGVPEQVIGNQHLKGVLEGSLLDIKYEVSPSYAIVDPKAYLEEFIRIPDLGKYKAALDALVANGIKTREEAETDFNAAKIRQDESLQRVAAAGANDIAIAAAFVAANRPRLDKAQGSLDNLRLAQGKSLGTDIQSKLNNIKLAIAEIGILVGGPALIVGGVAVYVPGQSPFYTFWASAGAVLGAGIFSKRIIAQKNIIEANAIALFDETIIAVKESFSNDFQLRTSNERSFMNKVAYKVNTNFKLRNLQPSDASSEIPLLKEFVSLYLTFQQLWRQFMSDFGDVPSFLPLKQEDAIIDYSKATIEVTENQKVGGGLIKENEVYKVKFETDEVTDQKFTFVFTYSPPDILPLKQNIKAILQIPQYKVVVIKGNNQVAPPKESLRDSLIIQVMNEAGKPVEGYQVSWKVTAGRGVLVAGDKTDRFGMARAKWAMGAAEEENKAEAVVSDKDGSELKDGKVTFTADARNEYQLKYVYGNNQSAPFGENLADELTVRLIDHKQLPVAKQQVWWAVTEGGGALSTISTITDQNGEAKVKWRLGPSGVQKAIAFHKDKDSKDVPGSPVVFTATDARYKISYVSGTGQTVAPGEKTALPLKVQVTDHANKPVNNATVQWKIASHEGGTLSDPTSITDAEGYATTYYTPTSLHSKTIQAFGFVSGTTVEGGPVSFSVTSKYEHRLTVSEGQGKIFVGHLTGGKPFIFQLTDKHNKPITNASLFLEQVSKDPTGKMPSNPQIQNFTSEPANYSLKTDEEGKVSVNISIEWLAGNYDFRVSHAQYDSNFQSEMTEDKFSLIAEHPFTFDPAALSISALADSKDPRCTNTAPGVKSKSNFVDSHGLINASSTEEVNIYYKGNWESPVGNFNGGNYMDGGNTLKKTTVFDCYILYEFDKSTSTFLLRPKSSSPPSTVTSLSFKDIWIEVVKGNRIYRSNVFQSANSVAKWW